MKTVKKQKDTLTFKQALTYYNDFSLHLVPFDQSIIEFQTLIGRIKRELKESRNTTGSTVAINQIRFEGLGESLIRIPIESLVREARDVVIFGNYARTAKDVTSLLSLFTRNLHKSPLYEEAIKKLLSEVETQVDLRGLGIRHLMYLVDSLINLHSTNPELTALVGKDYMRRLRTECLHNLFSSNLNYVVKMIKSFTLFDSIKTDKEGDEKNNREFFDTIEDFLRQYLVKSKKSIFGKDLGNLLQEIAHVREQDSSYIQEPTINRLETLFITDHEKINFAIEDLANVLDGFERINQFRDQDKVIAAAKSLTLQIYDHNDYGYLKLFKILGKQVDAEILEFAQAYFLHRFLHLDARSLTAFTEFMAERGLWDSTRMDPLLEKLIESNFYSYSLTQLIDVYSALSLITTNYQLEAGSSATIPSCVNQTIQDAIKMRADHNEDITADEVSRYIDAFQAVGHRTKKQMKIIKKLVENHPELQHKLTECYVRFNFVDKKHTIDVSSLDQLECEAAALYLAKTKKIDDITQLLEKAESWSLTGRQSYHMNLAAKAAGLSTTSFEARATQFLEGQLTELMKDSNIAQAIIEMTGAEMENANIVLDGAVGKGLMKFVDGRTISIEDEFPTTFTDIKGNVQPTMRAELIQSVAPDNFKTVNLLDLDLLSEQQEYIEKCLE